MNFRVNMVPIFASNYSTMQHVNRLASDIQQDNLLITNIKCGSLKDTYGKVKPNLDIILPAY